MTLEFFARKRIIRCLKIFSLWSVIPQDAAIAESNGPATGQEPNHSRNENIIAASFLGAGAAVVVTSMFLDVKSEIISGYRDIGGVETPIKISTGSNTENMVLIGALIMAFGTLFLLSPSGDDHDRGEHAKGIDQTQSRVELSSTILASGAAGIGISGGF